MNAEQYSQKISISRCTDYQLPADRGFAIDPFYRTGKLYGEETDGAGRRKKFDGFWNGKKQCEDLCAIQ